MRKSTRIRDVAQALAQHAATLADYPDLQTWSGFLRMQSEELLKLSRRVAALESQLLDAPPTISDLASPADSWYSLEPPSP